MRPIVARRKKTTKIQIKEKDVCGFTVEKYMLKIKFFSSSR